MREALEFQGRRWPAARVAGHSTALVAGEPPSLVIEVSGSGRAYAVLHAEGWWRDLAELRPHDESRVLSFLQRRGDPLGLLAPGHRIDTKDWKGLIWTFRQAAMAWGPRQALEVSTYGGGEVQPVEGERAFLKSLQTNYPGWAADLGVTFQGLEPVVKADSLQAYMIAAAMAGLRRKLPMRPCNYCSSWFYVTHAAARFCTSSCRAASGNKKVSPHGVA